MTKAEGGYGVYDSEGVQGLCLQEGERDHMILKMQYSIGF